jgi:hypothetical protein
MPLNSGRGTDNLYDDPTSWVAGRPAIRSGAPVIVQGVENGGRFRAIEE